MLSSGQCAHLLHAISGLPVIDERHNDLDALLGHLIQDEVNRLEHRLIVHTCTAMCAYQQQKAGLASRQASNQTISVDIRSPSNFESRGTVKWWVQKIGRV